MVDDHRETLCEPATDRSFDQIIWDEFLFLLTIGGIWSFTHTRAWKIFTVLNYTFMYTTVVSTMGILAYTCYLTKDNLSLFSQTSHIFIIGAVVLTASATLTMNRAKILQFRDLFDNPYGLAEFSKTEFFDEQIKKTANKKKKLIFTFMTLYGACGVIGTIQPVINSAFGDSEEVPEVEGVWTNLPFALWVPYYDLENDNTAWLVVYTLENLYLFYAALMVVSSINLCFFASDMLLDQLKLNINGVHTLNQRAKEMFKKKYPGGVRKAKKKEYDDCYYQCLIENVQHHDRTKRCFILLMDLASIPIAVPFYGGALLLGMALITLTSHDDPRAGPKVLAAALAFSETANMYLLCRTGQDFHDLSWKLFESLFFAQWYTRSTKCTKAIIMMRYGCSRPFKMTAARMLNLNMELFADLVQSAYSIFNLQAASKSD